MPDSYSLIPVDHDPFMGQLMSGTSQRYDPANAMGGAPDPRNSMGGSSSDPANAMGAMGAPLSPRQQQDIATTSRLNQWLSKHASPQAGNSSDWDNLISSAPSPTSPMDRAVESYFRGGR